ncbi:MAG: hypothetical protein CMK32_05240 [Porticoccaceae bacterium]|nr:hypothetical protein [Porticoccaceae bacterium]
MDTHLPNAPVDTARKKAPGDAAPGALEATTREQAKVSDIQILPRPRPGSNIEQILKHLADGDDLTTLGSVPPVWLYGIHSVVSYLKRQYGVTCERQMVSIKNHSGRVANVARYWLEPGSPGWQLAVALLSGGD